MMEEKQDLTPLTPQDTQQPPPEKQETATPSDKLDTMVADIKKAN